MREQAREYEKEFPSQLYEEWYRLYDLPRPVKNRPWPVKNRPWKFKSLTIQHVYEPLAKSNGKILHLVRQSRADANAPHKKLHQFLADIGVKALRTHLGQLLGIAQVSEGRAEYEKNVVKVFGGQIAFDF